MEKQDGIIKDFGKKYNESSNKIGFILDLSPQIFYVGLLFSFLIILHLH